MAFAKKPVSLVIAAVLALLANSCGQVSPMGTAAATPPVLPGGPSIRITAPDNFQNVQTTANARNIRVAVSVANFKLVEYADQKNSSGEGHIRYSLDIEPPVAGRRTPAHGTARQVETARETYFWKGLSDGPHVLGVELVNNDGTSLSPPVTDWVQTYLQFNILAPRVQIIAPIDGSIIEAGDVTVKVEIHNFVISDRSGRPNLPGQGHLHYFYDADPPIEVGKPATTANGTWAESTADSYTWHDVPPGSHTFAAELVTNDHLPLYPPSLRPAYDIVAVNVVGAK